MGGVQPSSDARARTLREHAANTNATILGLPPDTWTPFSRKRQHTESATPPAGITSCTKRRTQTKVKPVLAENDEAVASYAQTRQLLGCFNCSGYDKQNAAWGSETCQRWHVHYVENRIEASISYEVPLSCDMHAWSKSRKQSSSAPARAFHEPADHRTAKRVGYTAAALSEMVPT